MKRPSTVERYQTGLRSLIGGAITKEQFESGLFLQGYHPVPMVEEFRAWTSGRIVILMIQLKYGYSGRLRIDLQVARTPGEWYGLGNANVDDINSWKDEREEYTRISTLSYTHGPIPLNSDDEGKPLPTTYYYRARTVRFNDVTEPWTEAREVTVRPVSNADLMQNAVTRLEMDAGFIHDFDYLVDGVFPYGLQKPSTISVHQASLIGAQNYLAALEDRVNDTDWALEINQSKILIQTEELVVLASQVSETTSQFATLQLTVDDITTTVGAIGTTVDGQTLTQRMTTTIQRVGSIETVLEEINIGDGTAIDLASIIAQVSMIESKVFTGELDENEEPIWKAGTVVQQLSDQIASMVFDTESLPEEWTTPIASMITQEAGRITQTIGILTGDGENIEATGGIRGDVTALDVTVDEWGTQIAQTIDYVRIASLATEMITDELYETYQSAIDVTASRIGMVVESMVDDEQFAAQVAILSEQISAKVSGRRWNDDLNDWEEVPSAALYLGVEQLPITVSRNRYVQMEAVVSHVSLLEAVYTHGEQPNEQDEDGYWDSYVIDVTATQEQQDALYGELRPHSLLVSQVAVSASEILLEGSVHASLINVDSLAASTGFIASLTSKVAFIDTLTANNLFIHNLKMTEGFFDSITSHDAFFVNVDISGNSYFHGVVDSGPLYLNPATTQSTVNATNIRADTLRTNLANVLSGSAWHPITPMNFRDYLNTWRYNLDSIRGTYAESGDNLSQASNYTWNSLYALSENRFASSCDDTTYTDVKTWEVSARQANGTVRRIALYRITRTWGCTSHWREKHLVWSDPYTGAKLYYYYYYRTYSVTSDWAATIDQRAVSCTITYSGMIYRLRNLPTGPGGTKGDVWVDSGGNLKVTL